MDFDIRNIAYAYGQNPAITGFRLRLESGRFYAVTGPNGCGKTTLLDLLCGHRRPDRGRILLGGREIGAYRKKALAQQIALVPQEFRVNFAFTAREIAAMGCYPRKHRFASLSRADMAYVESVLASCGAGELSGRFMTELSGGEKQRVVFARALVQNTPVLLLDEPCASLDVKHALALLDMAAKRARQDNVLVVAVMHDINLAARYADAMVFMQNGRVAAGGATEDVLDAAVLRRVFEVDARISFEPAINAPQVVFLR